MVKKCLKTLGLNPFTQVNDSNEVDVTSQLIKVTVSLNPFTQVNDSNDYIEFGYTEFGRHVT